MSNRVLAQELATLQSEAASLSLSFSFQGGESFLGSGGASEETPASLASISNDWPFRLWGQELSFREIFLQVSQAATALPGQAAMALQVQGPHWQINLGFNQKLRFPAASLIKLAILGELFRRFQEGTLDPQERLAVPEQGLVAGAGVLFECGAGREFSLRELARLMIVVSDNQASNMLVDKLGFDSINQYLQLVGAQSSMLGRKFMYPSYDGDNYLTAEDSLRLLRPFTPWSGAGFHLQPFWAIEALDILHRQQFIEKIPSRLPEKWYTANKTGELERVRHDLAYLQAVSSDEETPQTRELFVDPSSQASRKAYTKLSDRAMLLGILCQDIGENWQCDQAMASLASICGQIFLQEF